MIKRNLLKMKLKRITVYKKNYYLKLVIKVKYNTIIDAYKPLD